MRITSAANPLFRRLRRLADSPRACRETGRTLAEGIHVIEAALEAGTPIVTLISRGEPAAAIDTLWRREPAASPAGATIRIELAPSLYDLVAPVEHGVGVLAEIAIPPSQPLSRLAADGIYLDAVQDPGNVGTLLRTAAAAGVTVAVTGPGCAYAWSPKVMRAAMGAHFVLSIHEGCSVADVTAGFEGQILAADLDGDDLFAADWGAGATLWLFGSEGQGLSPQARAAASQRLRIPVADGVESLNVAAAAAVCLFEQARRRRAAQ